MTISPSAYLRMLRLIREIDVRAVLPAIHVPTLVIQRLGDRINPPFYGRYLASHIPGARYFEQPGDHVLRFAEGEDLDELFSEIEDLLAAAPRPAEPTRVLTTILLAAGVEGGMASSRVRSHRGVVRSSSNGERILATFDAPGQAIRCAAAIREDAATTGMRFRAGIHTGEVDLAGDGIAGLSVEIADRVQASAQPGEILVSRTVKDLVVGSGISFAERSSHALAATDDSLPLFAVTTS